ncbi:PREDICTED: non-structural maintenance of chromosomes element 4 homolog B-like [Camelina sativa]|uniref:Non-structural maintenance of chromosomes element 4 n=1 Tax=Camelina sativa TaxID=90675 RepID=A0ABM0Z1Y9_CAMSA|nr:PREDICTED: non-structural maintenance of chromosomes element 4 homolog B-like [Camelina sativa]
MRNSVKREAESTGDRSRRREADEPSSSAERPKIVKKEKQNKSVTSSVPRSQEPPIQEGEEQGIDDRRAIRSQYLALTHEIKDAKDDLTKVDSDKFNHIINEVENLHQKVQKPREQVADAEALLDLVDSVVSSVKSQSAHGGVSPAEFVNALINGFGKTSLRIDADEENRKMSMNWKDLGFAVCTTVLVSCGCSTMIGPMDTKLKQRKRSVGNRKRTKPGSGVRPEEVDNTEKKTDTDKNMAIMFNILRKNKRVKIENLVLNRKSFAQTVENVFALSFLVKDGRVEINVDQNGSHFVEPRNAPAANLVMSGEVVHNHYVLRFDYKDWEPMRKMVAVGEELMPHRETKVVSSTCDLPSKLSQDSHTKPIRNLSRKQGLMSQEETAVEDSTDIEGDNEDSVNRRECKLRKTHL